MSPRTSNRKKSRVVKERNTHMVSYTLESAASFTREKDEFRQTKKIRQQTTKQTKQQKYCLVAKGKRTYFIIISIFLFIASLVKHATTNVMSLFSQNWTSVSTACVKDNVFHPKQDLALKEEQIKLSTYIFLFDHPQGKQFL